VPRYSYEVHLLPAVTTFPGGMFQTGGSGCLDIAYLPTFQGRGGPLEDPIAVMDKTTSGASYDQ
jgi:hypothetical protein